MVTIPKKVSERLSEGIRRYKRILKRALRNVNQTDTVAIVKEMLSEVFGFDRHSDVFSGQFNDDTDSTLAVLSDCTIAYLVKAIAIGVPLKESHLRQAAKHCITQDIPWVVLTNSIDWHVYKVNGKR